MLPRAPKGGACLYGRRYAGGEFEPFYVPRPFMPQIDESDFESLLRHAESRGVAYQLQTIAPPHVVRFHQRVDHDRARGMPDSVYRKPILVSSEPYVLDGNHRLWEHIDRREPVQAYRFALDWDSALRFLFSFPKTYTFATLANPNTERN